MVIAELEVEQDYFAPSEALLWKSEKAVDAGSCGESN
jgi:hypothetical protein